ncbi:hypothetical protein [Neobacillus mesonae]|uniref:hypothetical protein n=1 Tax=Neobacillus mesonae TaxID=1193713 RepID=UPI002573F001|nr:hypothetical protein [Neobacillus mesonae]MED4204105.1 hypothetical protein [Neobacillus mesonae]
MRKKYLLTIITLILLTTGVAYADTNTNYQLRSWLENKVGEVKSSIQLSLLNLVQIQKNYLSEKNSQLTSSNNGLSLFSDKEKKRTIMSMQEKLKGYKAEVNLAASTLEKQHNNQFNLIVNKINNKTTQSLNNIGSESEKTLLQDINTINYGKKNQDHDKSTDKLKKEIDATRSLIYELKTALKKETNPVVKNYLEEKINFLTEMISLLET